MRAHGVMSDSQSKSTLHSNVSYIGSRLHCSEQHNNVWEFFNTLHHLHLIHHHFQAGDPRRWPDTSLCDKKGQD